MDLYPDIDFYKPWTPRSPLRETETRARSRTHQRSGRRDHSSKSSLPRLRRFPKLAKLYAALSSISTRALLIS